MKKVLIILLIVAAIIAAVILFMLVNKQDDATNEGGTITTEPTKPTTTIGDAVTDEDVVSFYDENYQQYTAENLPNGYDRKDFDGDGLNNKDEIANGTDMYKVDTDGDGIGDHDEIYKTKTNPLKWSSRDDNISDLEYSIINGKEFKAGYTDTDANGFKVYLDKPEDRLYIISKVSTDSFNDLETISEAFQIKCFNGKMALNCNKYIAEVANSIAIYKDVNGAATKIETTVDENNLVVFKISENDIFVVVYESEDI